MEITKITMTLENIEFMLGNKLPDFIREEVTAKKFLKAVAFHSKNGFVKGEVGKEVKRGVNKNDNEKIFFESTDEKVSKQTAEKYIAGFLELGLIKDFGTRKGRKRITEDLKLYALTPSGVVFSICFLEAFEYSERIIDNFLSCIDKEEKEVVELFRIFNTLSSSERAKLFYETFKKTVKIIEEGESQIILFMSVPFQIYYQTKQMENVLIDFFLSVMLKSNVGDKSKELVRNYWIKRYNMLCNFAFKPLYWNFSIIADLSKSLNILQKTPYTTTIIGEPQSSNRLFVVWFGDKTIKEWDSGIKKILGEDIVINEVYAGTLTNAMDNLRINIKTKNRDFLNNMINISRKDLTSLGKISRKDLKER